jgi:hypothetical protein
MPLAFWHLQRRQHPAIRRTVVAVVEHRDIPAAAELEQKVKQRPRTLRKLEAEHAFIRHRRRMPANHMANVQLGQLVIG